MKPSFIFIFIFIINFVLCSTAYTFEDTDFIRSGDNLQKLAERNYNKVSFKYKKTSDFAEDLKKWNSQIKNWNHLTERQYVYVDYPYSPYTGNNWTEVLPLKKIPTDYTFQTSFLYKALKIDQEQLIYKLSSTKIIPFSFNGNYQINIFSSKMKLVFGVVWDYSIKEKISSTNNSIQNDVNKSNDFEFNSYLIRKVESFKSSFLLGTEFDMIQYYNFSTSNSETSLSYVNSNIYYLSLGIQRCVQVKASDLVVTGIISKSVFSSGSIARNTSAFKLKGEINYWVNERYALTSSYSFIRINSTLKSTMNKIGFGITINTY